MVFSSDFLCYNQPGMRKINQKLVWLFIICPVLGGVFLFLPQTVRAANFYVDSDVPVILPRASWDNTPALNALMTWLPDKNVSPSDYQPVERIIIHDTGCDIANPTCNNNQNSVATIQAIYRYHAVTRGWGDIGYNYIIDQQGRIYEGRYGGNGSRGAHVFVDRTRDNFNFGTIGITVLGNYAKIQPPEAVYQSLSRLVAWLAATNNLDPQGTRSSSIWNLLTSEFSSLYNGPIVVGHKDVEKGNPDPATFDFSRIRREATAFAGKYKNYIYQVDGLPRVYKIFSGTRQIYDDLPTFVNAGGVYQKSVAMAQSQVDLFSESRFLKYPDGSLLRIKDNPIVYLIQDGKKRNLNVSAKQFMALGFDFARVRIVEADDLTSYPEGEMIKYGPDNQLLSDGQRVFLIQGGKKHWVVSGELFSVLKYSWSKIKRISSEELAYYPVGDYVKYKDGTLLRSKDENNVYLISGGQRQIVTAVTFKNKKYKWANVLVIAAQDFQVLYNGAALPQALLPSPTPVASQTPLPTPTPIPTLTSTPNFLSGATPTPSVSPTPIAQSGAPKMRVAIYEVLSGNVTLTADTAFNILDKTGQVIAVKSANENYVYNISSPASAFVKIVPQNEEGVVQIVSYEDHPAWKPSLNYNQFHGAVEIVYSSKSNKIWAVNELLLEDYLKGVAETSEGDAAEYQKAMTVAARTYAQYYIQKGGKRGADEVYILNNTTSDQLYKGYAREILAPSIVQAVNDTRGEIMTYNGNPIVAAYSSGAAELQTIGTKSACALWGGQYCQAGFEYLSGGVKDPIGAEYSYASCGGANHCVGLSGAGARAFAKAGTKNYQEILRHYYTGTEVKKIY